MHRCSSGVRLTLAITLILALGGCLGESSSNAGNGGVQSISLNPTSKISLETGGTQVFTAIAKDALGRNILGVDIRFVVESGNPGSSAPLSIAGNGSACAGTWDATATQCSPGTSGIAIVTAVTGGVSSEPTTVYVHQHIDSLQITQAATAPPQFACFSQGQTWQFQATAYNNGVDITNTVGPLVWSSSNPGVATTSTTLATLLPNQVEITAKDPGVTQLFATVSGTTSSPMPYTTCLIQFIRLQIENQTGNSVTVADGGSVSIKATAVDTLFHVANSTALETPPLTWSTTNPEVAAFSTTANTTGSNTATARANLGGADVFASCTPPSCNIGVTPGLPIYASDGLLPNGEMGYGTISINVISTNKPPTYTAWAATTGCGGQSGCFSALFAVTPGVTPIGAIVSLPRTPNSMMFNHLAAGRVYFGSDQGLMFVDVTATSPSVALVSNASTPCNVALCGKVLAISNDGKLVVVADNVSTPHQVYIFGAGSGAAPVDLVIPNDTVTAAAFSPDQLKLFILTSTGKMFVYSTVDALNSVPIASSVTDAKFSADGSFAYVAGATASSVSAFSTCSLPGTASVDINNVTTSSTPLKIFPSPVVQADATGLTQDIIALEPPNVEILTAHDFTQVPIPYATPLQFTCNPPTIGSFTKGPLFNLGQGDFEPVYTQLVANGSEMIVVARHIPAVLIFNVGNGTTSSVPLVGNPDPLSADASTDGSQVYVAACDAYPDNDPAQPCAAGSVHIVNTLSQGDFQQVPYLNINDNNNTNMCSGQGAGAPVCLPNLIAIKPQ